MTNKEPYWLIIADTQLGAIHWNNLEREQDYYNAFQNLCSMVAEDPKCIGMLGLGDLRERASIQAKNLGGMNRGLKILLDANKPMLALMGNHDFTTPNWIEEMCYPCLKNFADPAVQAEYGFDPKTTIALDFKTRGELEAALLAAGDPEKVEVVFLHQSLRELTTTLKHTHDTSLEQLAALGFGKHHQCLIFMGDLHNYGDATLGNITAAYPGSPEMTDINEGVNGLKSDRVLSGPHDYRKFAIRYYPGSGTWEPIEIKVRPWFRGKAKTPKDTQRMLDLLDEAVSKWEKPGCITLTAPKKDMERVRDHLKNIRTLEARVEEFGEENEPQEWEAPESETSLSWQDNKKALLHMGEDSALDVETLQLLREIISRDGSTPNAKNDVASAWHAWIGDGESPEDLTENNGLLPV